MVTPEDVQAAHLRIAPHLLQTPVLSSRSLNQLANAELHFKCENFQRAGSFKFRGSTNTLLQLSKEELARGVATTSSGNHGAALTLAASLQNAKVTVVMPHNIPQVKVENVRRYGGKIVFCEPSHESREGTLTQLVERTGATVVHPYNDERIIAGQGTAAWELLKEHPDLDAVVSPVSGGGLLSGTLLAVQSKHPGIKVYGAEPMEADDTIRSLEAGHIVPQAELDRPAVRAVLGVNIGHNTSDDFAIIGLTLMLPLHTRKPCKCLELWLLRPTYSPLQCAECDAERELALEDQIDNKRREDDDDESCEHKAEVGIILCLHADGREAQRQRFLLG